MKCDKCPAIISDIATDDEPYCMLYGYNPPPEIDREYGCKHRLKTIMKLLEKKEEENEEEYYKPIKRSKLCQQFL